MNQKYASLFTPIKIGNCELKNRVAIAPMGGTGMIGGQAEFSYNLHDYYIDRARGGVGLIIPGIALLQATNGGWIYDHRELIEPIRELMDEIHSYGTKVFIQLGAGMGRVMMCNPKLLEMAEKMGPAGQKLKDLLYTAPSDGEPNVWMPDFKMRGLSKEEIHNLVAAYAKTAKMLQEAHVDGIEVHAVHEGYLLDQFTLKYCNHRTDEYGGCFENRYRFPVEVIKAIKAECPDFPVSLRYSVTSKTKGYNQGAVPGETFVEAGRDMEESERAIKLLSEAGYDMFNCDNGTYDAWYWAHPPVYMPLNCNLKEALHIRKFTDKPVFCAGRMELDVAAEVIGAEQLDGVSIGRQSLSDPEFLLKLQDERIEDIRPCIACHAGCFPVPTYKGAGVAADIFSIEMGKCALNPSTTGNEQKYRVIPAKEPKKIAVVGGGIGGMEFALQAAARGHKVDLYEKTDKLGGVFIAAAQPDFKEKDKALLKWYARQLEQSTVTIHMNCEIKVLDDLEADEIVVATGAKARTLKIPGAAKAVEAIEYLNQTKEVGDTVAVIGGGLTGCEIAYDLALKGKHPFIVEMMDDLIKAPGVCASNSNLLRTLLKFYKVPVYLESVVGEIKEKSVVINTLEGEKELKADSVITSVGYNSGTELAEGRTRVHILGDADKVGNLKTAIWAANDLALAISGMSEQQNSSGKGQSLKIV